MRNKYILMRHGETKYQALRLDLLYTKHDQKFLPITERGAKKIKEAAKKLKEKNIDIIYASDFFRTCQTAKIVSAETGARIVLHKKLRDLHMGVFHGRPAQEYRQFFISKFQRFAKRPPKGENWRDVKKRLKEAFRQIDKKHKGKTILIVTHGDPLWLMLGWFKGLTEKELLDTRGGLYPQTGQYFVI